ncbi:MAG TPA: hypothetical protein VNA22_01765 [Pyrinomonadaceae bacterium]|nr:hypothetical protein [Pyrinomonadaceae bacterium]
MKRCPECRRDYYDETLRYCLDDGAALVEGPASVEEPATAILPGEAVPDDASTRIYDKPSETFRQSPARDTSDIELSSARKWLIPLAAVLLLGAGAIALYVFVIKDKAAKMPIASLQQMKFTRVPVSGDVGLSFIAPDGKFIARIVRQGDKESLLLRQLSGTTEREVVAPTENYFLGGVTFSLDGSSLYYVMGESTKNYRRLYRVSVLGGDPQKLVDDVDSGISFSPDGKQLAFIRIIPEPKESRLIIANEDGSGERIVASRQPPTTFTKPEWSPDGQLLAHPIVSKDEDGEYTVLEATGTTDGSTRLSSPVRWRYISAIAWLPEGTGLVATGKTRSAPAEDRSQIWYVPFPGGEPQKITNDANNYVGVTLTADARMALVTQFDVSSNVWVATAAGSFSNARQITNSNSEMDQICWTPEGQIVYAAGGRYSDLWIMKSDGTGSRQLTFTTDRHETQPSLSPDGRHIVYLTTTQNGLRGISRIGIDGSGTRELVNNVDQRPDPQVSPDSRWVFYNTRDDTGQWAFWKVPFDGGEPEKVRDKMPCRLSPDGTRFLCFYQDPVPDTPPKAMIYLATGGNPQYSFPWPKGVNALFWAPDGEAIDFVAERGGIANIWRMGLDGSGEKKITDFQTHAPVWAFAFSRDAKQLAITRDTQTNHLILIQGFRE